MAYLIYYIARLIVALVVAAVHVRKAVLAAGTTVLATVAAVHIGKAVLTTGTTVLAARLATGGAAVVLAARLACGALATLAKTRRLDALLDAVDVARRHVL